MWCHINTSIWVGKWLCCHKTIAMLSKIWYLSIGTHHRLYSNNGNKKQAFRDIHYREQLWKLWKAQWKHSYLTFWFAGNGLPPTANNYCDFNATLTCNVIDEECNIQCPKSKECNRLYRNVSFFQYFNNDFQQFSGYPSIYCESMRIWCVQ